MGERYITIEQLNPGQRILINSIGYIVGEDGTLFLSESILFQTEIGLTEYERIISEKLNDAQQMRFYTWCGGCATILVGDIARVFEGDRLLAKEIIQLGILHGVMTRGFNSAYKVCTKMLKERMTILSERIRERLENKPVMNAEETLHKALKDKSYKLLDEEIGEQKEYSERTEETVHNPDIDESVKSTLSKTDLKKSIVIPPKRKPDLSKTLVKKQKPRN